MSQFSWLAVGGLLIAAFALLTFGWAPAADAQCRGGSCGGGGSSVGGAGGVRAPGAGGGRSCTGGGVQTPEFAERIDWQDGEVVVPIIEGDSADQGEGTREVREDRLDHDNAYIRQLEDAFEEGRPILVFVYFEGREDRRQIRATEQSEAFEEEMFQHVELSRELQDVICIRIHLHDLTREVARRYDLSTRRAPQLALFASDRRQLADGISNPSRLIRQIEAAEAYEEHLAEEREEEASISRD